MFEIDVWINSNMKLREIFSRLEEGLTKDQKRRLYSELKNLNYDRHRWAGVFGNRYRIYIEYNGELPEAAEVKSKYQEVVEDALWKIGNINGGIGWNTNRVGYLEGKAFRREYKKVPIEVAFRNEEDIITKWREDVANNTVEHEDDILNALSRSGCVMNPYTRASYMTGNFFRGADVTGSIGKLLSNGIADGIVDASLLKKFTNDPVRASAVNPKYRKKLMVVISRHPDDIGSMSTDRRWASCMNIDTGGFREYIPIEIAEGSVVAYLIRADDLKIEDPYARILIKPFVNADDGSIALGVQNSVYPSDAPVGFSKQVVDWADSVNASRKLNGLFKLNPQVYNDNPDKDSMTIGAVDKNNNYIKYTSESEIRYLLRDIAEVVDREFIVPEVAKLEKLDGGYWLYDLGYVTDDDEIDYDLAKKDGMNYIEHNKQAVEWRDTILKLITELDIDDINKFAIGIDGDFTATTELPAIVGYFVNQYTDNDFYHSAELSKFITKEIKLRKSGKHWIVD